MLLHLLAFAVVIDGPYRCLHYWKRTLCYVILHWRTSRQGSTKPPAPPVGSFCLSQAGQPQIGFLIRPSLAQNYFQLLSLVLTGFTDDARRFLVPLSNSHSICMQKNGGQMCRIFFFSRWLLPIRSGGTMQACEVLLSKPSVKEKMSPYIISG